MANFKPGFWVLTDKSTRKNEYVNAKTYRELKKKIKEYLPLSLSGEISVHRSRRGDWGEWFEVWQMRQNKPTIVKEGWN